MTFCKGYTQGGSNADVVIADALLKNITKGIDWATAYEAVVSDAEGEPLLVMLRPPTTFLVPPPPPNCMRADEPALTNRML